MDATKAVAAQEHLNALVRQAVELFAALTPEQQRAHLREQRISWLRGQIGLSRGEPMSYEEAAAAVDRHDGGAR